MSGPVWDEFEPRPANQRKGWVGLSSQADRAPAPCETQLCTPQASALRPPTSQWGNYHTVWLKVGTPCGRRSIQIFLIRERKGETSVYDTLGRWVWQTGIDHRYAVRKYCGQQREESPGTEVRAPQSRSVPVPTWSSLLPPDGHIWGYGGFPSRPCRYCPHKMDLSMSDGTKLWKYHDFSSPQLFVLLSFFLFLIQVMKHFGSEIPNTNPLIKHQHLPPRHSSGLLHWSPVPRRSDTLSPQGPLEGALPGVGKELQAASPFRDSNLHFVVMCFIHTSLLTGMCWS